MNAGRILYRTRQFWHALQAKPADSDLEEVSKLLNPQQMALFTSQRSSEQAHSIQVYRKLRTRGETCSDLFVAALLHDVGKSLYPLRIWERIWIVLARVFFPSWVRKWGATFTEDGTLRFWKRPFVVAEQHPIWGAEMAAQVGASSLAVSLIRRHQETLHCTQKDGGDCEPQNELESNEDRLLCILQSADDES